MEFLECTREHVAKIDAWLERNKYGLVVCVGEEEFPVTCTFKECLDDVAMLYAGESNYSIRAYISDNNDDKQEAAEIYNKEDNSIAAFALFRAERE